MEQQEEEIVDKMSAEFQVHTLSKNESLDQEADEKEDINQTLG